MVVLPRTWFLLLALLLLVVAPPPLLAEPAASPAPYLDSVTPNPATAGGVVRLEGRNLGSSQTGTILLGDRALAADRIRSWSDTTVELQLPAEARPGRISVRVGELTSQTLWLHVLSADAGPRPRPAAAEVGAEMAPTAEPSTPATIPTAGMPTPSAPSTAVRQAMPPSALVGDTVPGRTRPPFPGPGSPRAGERTGDLSIRVQDSNGKALYGAHIKLDGRLVGRTDSRGQASLDGLPAGDHGITVYHSEHRTAKGEVTIRPGQSRDLLVSLSPISPEAASGSAPPEERRTRFTVRAHPYHSDGQKYSVRRIEVTERGGASRTWQNTWYRTYDSYVELPCENAVIGRYYRITITWYNWRSRSELTSSWEPRVWKESQVETYDSP